MTVMDLWCIGVKVSGSRGAAHLLPSRSAAMPICLAMLLSVVAAGCGSAPEGPQRFPISGTVLREGIEVDDGGLVFTPTAGGPAVSGQVTAGKYQFTKQDGVPKGKYTVKITVKPLRDKTFKGRPNEAPILPDDRFKKKLPKAGFWTQEAEVTGDPKQTIDFAVE